MVVEGRGYCVEVVDEGHEQMGETMGRRESRKSSILMISGKQEIYHIKTTNNKNCALSPFNCLCIFSVVNYIMTQSTFSSQKEFVLSLDDWDKGKMTTASLVTRYSLRILYIQLSNRNIA